MRLTETELKNIARLCGEYDLIAEFNTNFKTQGVMLMEQSQAMGYAPAINIFLSLYDIELGYKNIHDIVLAKMAEIEETLL